MGLKIGSREIGAGKPCFIIAEVGLAHDGSLSQAHAYIDAIAKAGADAAKFQCHMGDLTTEWRVEPKYKQDVDRRAYWNRTGFTPEQWRDLADHCRLMGLEFLCSPFSIEAVLFLNPLLDAWKVPSGRITDMEMLDAIGRTRKPVLLSNGMGTPEEKEAAIKCLSDAGTSSVLVMHCTSLYPTPPQFIGLSSRPAGLSDHSGTIYPGIAAAALGCQVLEVHVCWSREVGGFDAATSLTMQGFGHLVYGVRFVEQAMRPVDKDALAEQLSETRRVFMGVSA
jgi:N-acetylneuraminate synthase